MKTHVMPLSRACLVRGGAARRRLWKVGNLFRSLAILLAATLPAAGVAVLATLGFSAGAPGLAAATLWATGIAFCALAVESSGHRATLLGATALLLVLLAWLSSRVSADFGIFAGFVVAAWVAAAIFGYLLRPVQVAADH
jgi:hypothetical protein